MPAITLLCGISDDLLLVLFVLSDERTSMATNHKDRCDPMSTVPSTSENKKQKRDSSH